MYIIVIGILQFYWETSTKLKTTVTLYLESSTTERLNHLVVNLDLHDGWGVQHPDKNINGVETTRFYIKTY